MPRSVIFILLFMCAAQVGAATIYECESISSGRFYSTNECNVHRAVIVSRHGVPDGMVFEQQVNLINNRRASRNSVQAEEIQANVNNRQCAAIDDELKSLQKKYNNWQYIPVEEVNADQAKERDLRSKRSKFGCAGR